MNDSYKNLFQGLLFILIVVLALLVISIAVASCRSAKESSRLETATTEVVTTSWQDLASVDHRLIDRNFTLSLDSLELWLHVGQDELLPFLPDTATLAQRAVAPSRSNGLQPVLLKARRATVSSGTVDSRTVVQTVQVQDSASNSQDTASQEHQSRVVVAVAHPVPPWVYILAAAVIALVLGLWLYRRLK